MRSGKIDIAPSQAVIQFFNKAYQYCREGNIERQLGEVRSIVELYSSKGGEARVGGVTIPSQQDILIKRLINAIKNHTPANYPEAKVIYALFLASQGKSSEALSYFEEIHKAHPNYLAGYIRHRALLATLPYRQNEKIEEINKAISEIESKKGKSVWRDNAAQILFEKNYSEIFKENMLFVYEEIFKSKKWFSIKEEKEVSGEFAQKTTLTSSSSSARNTPSPEVIWYPVKLPNHADTNKKERETAVSPIQRPLQQNICVTLFASHPATEPFIELVNKLTIRK